MKQISPMEQLKLKLENPKEEKRGTEPYVEEVDIETMMARASEDLDEEERLKYGHGHGRK